MLGGIDVNEIVGGYGMCGRFAQYRIVWEYLAPLGLGDNAPESTLSMPLGRYNVAPRSPVMLLSSTSTGLNFKSVLWGYTPQWAKGSRPPVINARVETVATSKFFRSIWKGGRCIVPADGWYEWLKPAGERDYKQPYYIRRADDQPMYFAGLGQFSDRGITPEEGDGFVIITGGSDSGLVDIHDRKPLVLPPDAARQWLEPGMDGDAAYELLLGAHEPASQFKWYPVGREVGNVRNQGPELIQPLG